MENIECKRKRDFRCGNCGNIGHNKRTCNTPTQLIVIDLTKEEEKRKKRKKRKKNINNDFILINGKVVECSICFYNLKKKDVVSTTCGHIFHKKCLQDCFKTWKKKCPMCRTIQKLE